MPPLSHGPYTPQDLIDRSKELLALSDYFESASQTMKTKGLDVLEIYGKTGEEMGMDGLRNFKAYTEKALRGAGPKPAKKPKPTTAKKSRSKKKASA